MPKRILEAIVEALAEAAGKALGDELAYAYQKGKVSETHEFNKDCPPRGCEPGCICTLVKEETGIREYEYIFRKASSHNSYAYRIPSLEIINRYYNCLCCGPYGSVAIVRRMNWYFAQRIKKASGVTITLSGFGNWISGWSGTWYVDINELVRNTWYERDCIPGVNPADPRTYGNTGRAVEELTPPETVEEDETGG